MAEVINGEFSRQISRELGNIDARLKNIEIDTKCNSNKIDTLRHSFDNRFNSISAKVYTISGGIAVFGIITGLVLRKVFGG